MLSITVPPEYGWVVLGAGKLVLFYHMNSCVYEVFMIDFLFELACLIALANCKPHIILTEVTIFFLFHLHKL